MTRLHEIRAAVRDLSAPNPAEEPPAGFWHKPDRGSPDYNRLVIGGEPTFDVWLETEAEFNRAGFLDVRAEVVFHNVELRREVDRKTVFDREFTGNDQPREQCFLLNMPTYADQIGEAVQAFAERAVNRGPVASAGDHAYA